MGKKSKQYNRKKDLKPNKKSGGIWVTNKFGKVKSKKRCPPTPLVKKCSVAGCDKRVKYHHWLCEVHWRERNLKDKIKK